MVFLFFLVSYRANRRIPAVDSHIVAAAIAKKARIGSSITNKPDFITNPIYLYWKILCGDCISTNPRKV
jgi:hypothetical protein